MNASTKRRWEIGLALFGAACFLACGGLPPPGDGGRERDVEGPWHGSVVETKREATHDLRLSIERHGAGEPLTAVVYLDGESAPATRVESGSKRTVRIWYELPSGRAGRVRGRVGPYGYRMRGVLRLEELDGKVYGPRFKLEFGTGSPPPELTLVAEQSPAEESPAQEVPEPSGSWEELTEASDR